MQEEKTEAVPVVPAPVFTPEGINQPVVPAQQGNYFPTYDSSLPYYNTYQPQGAPSNYAQQNQVTQPQSHNYQQANTQFPVQRANTQRIGFHFYHLISSLVEYFVILGKDHFYLKINDLKTPKLDFQIRI